MAEVDIGRALSGLGAAFKNEMPAFIQQTRQEDALALQQSEFDRNRLLQDEALAEKRRKTMFQDAAAASSLLDSGDYRGIADLMEDRITILGPTGADTNHSNEKRTLALRASVGDQRAIGELKRLIANEVGIGYSTGILTKPEPSKPISVGAGGALFDPLTGKEIFSNPAIDKTIEKESMPLEEQMYREGIIGQMSRIRSDLDFSESIIGTANEVQMLTQALGKADLNVGERFLADRFGMRGIALAGLGPETEAAQTLINKLAPRMRPKGSGSTSDIEISMYIQSLPAFLQSSEGRQLTNLAFQAAADIEREKISNEEKYTNRDITLNEYLSASRELRSRSIFTDSMKARVNQISAGFFDGVTQARRDVIYTPINTDITLSQ